MDDRIPANCKCSCNLPEGIYGMIDAHAHHNCGATCPLPLVYAQVGKGVNDKCSFPIISNLVDISGIDRVETSPYHRMKRGWVEWVIKLGYSEGVDIQRLSTVEMGRFLVELNTDMFEESNSNNVYARYKKLFDIRTNIKNLLRDKAKRNLSESEQEKLEKLKEEEIAFLENRTNAEKKAIPSLIIVPTMDMELAQFNGYFGEYIYQQDKDAVFYFVRLFLGKNALLRNKRYISHEKKSKEEISREAEAQGIAVKSVDEDDKLIFQKWKRQVRDTEIAAVSDPLRLFPLFFYDPRRYRYAKGAAEKDGLDAWDAPFGRIASKSHPGMWIGFKMYPSLGYRPFDEFCEYLPRFYEKCQNEEIPILTHCSPGGMITHEARFYKRLGNGGDRDERREKQRSMLLGMKLSDEEEKKACDALVKFKLYKKDYDNKEEVDRDVELDYFYKNYGHPENWRPVLEKFPRLRLCLAHFGGDEWGKPSVISWAKNRDNKEVPREWIKSIIKLTRKYDNVYTDISCMDIKNEHIRDALSTLLRLIKDNDEYKHLKNKLIFGTDWYLTYLTSAKGYAQYSTYCGVFKKLFDDVDKTFWERFSLINPWNCYSLSAQKFTDVRTVLEELAETRGIEFETGIADSTLAVLRKLDTCVSKDGRGYKEQGRQ